MPLAALTTLRAKETQRHALWSVRWVAAVFATTLVYFAAGKLALLLAIPPGYATAVWPPAGFALAAILILGNRVWPGIFIGSFLVNLGPSLDATSTSAILHSLFLPAVIAIGPPVQALINAILVRKFVGPTAFTTEKKVLRFSALVCASCVISSTVAASTLYFGGKISATDFFLNWATWYVGDAIGALIFAPLTLIWKIRAQSFRRKLSVSIPLVFTFALVVVSFFRASKWERERIEVEFENRSNDLAERLQHDFEVYTNVLRSLESFFASSNFVDREEFRVFVEHDLASRPAIRGVSWNPRVPASERTRFEQNARASGFKDFEITEFASNGKLAPARQRADYIPVWYVAPYDVTNARVIGIDVASDATRRAALERARDTGELAATARTVLIQDAKRMPAFLVYLPIYANGKPHRTLEERRQYLRGYVAAMFAVADLVNQSIQGLDRSGIELRLFDETEPKQNHLLFGPLSRASEQSKVHRAVNFTMAGRRWAFEFALTPEYLLAHRSWQSWSLLVGGLLFTALLGAFLLVVTGRTERDKLLVEERTAELVAVNARLECEIVDRRAAEAANQQILDNSLDVICTVDAEGRFTRLSRATEKLWGYQPNELIGRPYLDLVHPDDREKTIAIANDLMAGKAIRNFENRYLRKDESIVPVIWTARWSELEKTTFAIARDASVQKRAEAALTSAKEAAETASRAKSEFLANMSHEIRTPMNGIIGMTELALETELTRTQREYLDMVKYSADSLLGLINDILDFSKIEAGKLSLESIPFDLRLSLEKTLKTLGIRADRKGLELTCRIESDVPACVIGDPVRLRQVVINLIDNAIKFTQEGEVNLVVKVAEVAEDRIDLEFCVSDTGIGIAPEKQEMIFTAFAQADGSTTRNYGGTGLGLTISSWLVTQMGGRLTLESERNKGSTFRFIAKFRRELEQPQGKALMANPSLTKLPVLVVDDSATTRGILHEMLTAWGLAPMSVASAAEAVSTLESAAKEGNPFQLVLLDALMPRHDGLTFAKQVGNMPSLERNTLVLISSVMRPDEIAEWEKLGFVNHLTKPVTQSELLDAIVKMRSAFDEPEGAVEERDETQTGAFALRLLIVDDNPVNRAVAGGILGKRGYLIDYAENGLEAINFYRREYFDLILMDLQMPVLDGLDATAEIRILEEGKDRRTPIIAMTAHAMKGDRERCLEAGMDGYIAKPVNKQELLDVVQKFTAVLPDEEENKTNGALDQELLAHFDGDADLLQRVGKMFSEQAPPMLEKLRKAVATQDATGLKQTAHTLIGSLGALGADAAVSCARQLETLAQDNAFAPAEKIITKLENEVDTLQSRLATIT